MSKFELETPFAELQDIAAQLNEMKRVILEREKDIKTGRVTQKTLYSILASLESITQNVRDEIVATDEEFRIKFFNRAAEEMFGIMEEEVLTKRAGEIIQLENINHAPVDIEKLLTEARDTKKEINFSTKEYLSVIRKDGKKIAVAPSISLAREAEGSNILVMVFKNIGAELEVQKLRDEFVFAAAHELRTPISIINIYLELIYEHKEKLDSETINYLEAIERANEKLLNLINDLLDVARAQADKLKLNLAPVTTRGIIEEAIKQVEPLAQKNKQNILDVSLPLEASPVVLSDPTRLLKIINNLLTNSVKYTPQGGTITVKQEIKDDRLITMVSDTGLGISKEDAKNVFERFWRSGVVRDIQGTGLGLFIVKQLMDRMNGEIWFVSPAAQEFAQGDEKNPGTTFYFSLPLVKENVLKN